LIDTHAHAGHAHAQTDHAAHGQHVPVFSAAPPFHQVALPLEPANHGFQFRAIFAVPVSVSVPFT